MSGWTQSGSCPKCGAPIYVPTVWHGVTPPPPRYTCNCNPQTYSVTTNNTSNQSSIDDKDE